jgi:hypothetical protein
MIGDAEDLVKLLGIARHFWRPDTELGDWGQFVQADIALATGDLAHAFDAVVKAHRSHFRHGGTRRDEVVRTGTFSCG